LWSLLVYLPPQHDRRIGGSAGREQCHKPSPNSPRKLSREALDSLNASSAKEGGGEQFFLWCWRPKRTRRIGIEFSKTALRTNPCRDSAGVFFLKDECFGFSESRDSEVSLPIAVTTIDRFCVRKYFR